MARTRAQDERLAAFRSRPVPQTETVELTRGELGAVLAALQAHVQDFPESVTARRKLEAASTRMHVRDHAERES